MVDTAVGSSSVQDGVGEGMPTPESSVGIDLFSSVRPKNDVCPRKMGRHERIMNRRRNMLQMLMREVVFL